jgi:hypothetical protein
VSAIGGNKSTPESVRVVRLRGHTIGQPSTRTNFSTPRRLRAVGAAARARKTEEFRRDRQQALAER